MYVISSGLDVDAFILLPLVERTVKYLSNLCSGFRDLVPARVRLLKVTFYLELEVSLAARAPFGHIYPDAREVVGV